MIPGADSVSGIIQTAIAPVFLFTFSAKGGIRWFRICTCMAVEEMESTFGGGEEEAAAKLGP